MKKCPFCAEEIQEAAIKCRFCGSMLTAAEPAPLPVPGVAAPIAAPLAKAGPQVPSEARVLFDGHPSWKAWFGRTVAAAFVVVVGTALAIWLLAHYWETERVYSLGGVALAVIGVIWFLWIHFDRRSIHVHITTQTIDVERGIFGRTIDSLQLWRVRDVELDQTFIERVLGIARIKIMAHDVSQPNMTLIGLPGSRRLFDEIRDAIAIARQSRNVVGVVD